MTGNEAAGALGVQGYGATLWEPDAATIANARMTAYMRWLEGRGTATSDYDSLWRWSVDNPAEFWDSIWDFFEVLGSRGDGPVLTGTVMPDVHWFEGASLNYARNALRFALTDPDRIALIHYSERTRGGSGGPGLPGQAGADPEAGTLTFGQLAAEVGRVAAGLRALGVGRGDRVVGLIPNIPEAVIALLATASIGAIWSSCSPDFGTRSVVDRFAQIEPAVFITVDGYTYNGKEYPRGDVVAEITAALPTLRAVVTIGLLGAGETSGAGQAERGSVMKNNLIRLQWGELGTGSGGADLEFEEVPFEHPLWVLYSSGTTGLPKPIMHGHGGIVLEHLKSLALSLDLGPGDRFTWYTTTGWMMWNFLVSGLLTGTTTVLYDGSATYPETGRLWRLAAQARLTYLGLGAPYIMTCQKAGLRPKDEYDLSALRGVGSTGSPLPPEGFDWAHAYVGARVQLGSMSGGTDLCAGFVGPSPLLPVRSGIISGRFLGAKAEAFDDQGTPVTGKVGELVVTVPMPSMPVGFWNDPEGTRYRESYYADFPGVWRHGDWVEFFPDGGCVIYGRSDATLNRGGVRMGTSEFYRVVESFPEIADSLVVDTGRLGTEGRLVLYVALADGAAGAGAAGPGGAADGAAGLGGELAARLRGALRAQLSPRHVPDEIIVVPGIPRTLSGKKLEIPVRKILLGTPVAEAADPSALVNPEVLGFFAPRREAF